MKVQPCFIKMDINSLRVFDSLYKLKISEQEFSEIEDEIRHEERTGLSIKAVKKGFSICVSHDEKHKVIIKKIEFDGKLPQPKSRVLFKTLILFEDLPDEIYTLHQIAQYRALDTEIKRVANTMEDLKDKIRKALEKTKPGTADVKGSDKVTEGNPRGTKLTLSFGVAGGSKDNGLEAVIGQADKLLYKAKNEGRNRVAGG